MKPSPTLDKDRIITLDIVRGFALFGILLANMSSFKTPVFHLQSLPDYFDRLPSSLLDQWTVFFLDLFVIGKFYPMFSFLFGLGFYLFYERLSRKDLNAKHYYYRRLLFLLVLGFLHLLFIWSGDILHTYAIAGFFLIFFINRRSKTLLIWALLLLSSSAIFFFLLTTAGNYVVSLNEGTVYEKQATDLVETARQLYQHGDYTNLLAFRLKEEVSYILLNVLFILPNIIGLFLLGMWAAQKKLFQSPESYKSFWINTAFVSLLFGGGLSSVYALLKNSFLPIPSWLAHGAAEGLNIIAGPLFMMFYLSLFVLFLRRPQISRILQPLELVGKIALTNYLLQSLICIFIFYGFGFGWYGSIGVFAGTSIALIIFGMQIMFSWFWLKRFNRGPLEILWRAWTYR
ncbi:DUF418 domain-containing protein [Alteribacillus iranensis]|uniref:DUF418 domain-containing protein n=1 Tax=Alteribacillus iranensis TaxID=930128 RepID=A0A1I2CSX5_9BACI|nr:DUF418 domain-containing protein [Alteribacillus iranensis]SFE71419.1 uncharacterized protein SAMN05192532_103184 [Alteribacillus iranensis]